VTQASTPPVRRILLADADAFYVAVARLVDPAGAGKARLLIVGGAAESRGVVTSASYAARAYGVHSAMPMARAMQLCPGATVVPVPWAACAEQSHKIASVLRGFTPTVEQASSDEFYLDLSGTSKLVAKLAASRAKPRPGAPADGVRVVAPGAEAAFLREFALAELPQVGPKFQERLARLGWHTVRDVVSHGEETLIRQLGEREGRWLYQQALGVDYAAVAPDREAKSLSRDETFPVDLDDDAALAAKLLALADRASADLRDAGLVARTVTVKLRDADFTTRQASRTLPDPVQADRVVYTVARGLLDKLRRARRTPARLLGVALSQLVPLAAHTQLTLLDAPSDAIAESERDRTISQLIDQVRERFGPDALGRAGCAPRAAAVPSLTSRPGSSRLG
jgi:DNA polymerase-4